ncbi:uncharacterized protein TRIADDRAFT_18537 [Trichoplax adhaerens]|uniref:Centrosomal protein of 76 kDa n=1 Tax=Trichoplax adhaerens TaxID=10228 RepID=B3RJ21_TRIAD|nr:hypothetical protein TRIADDRAFT_18537 [Trichoplax adhaerens]EDV29045.1 hypothetical protein TRIADDRAFT_18537 [Trichoplax adhaerens]|eukprot:XP_002108247.1 hypothetical protein TRIADDRAFT_18537 [Trichoplax adhaerens]
MTQLNINSVISRVIDELMQEGNQIDENQLLEALRQRGIVDEIVKSLKFQDNQTTTKEMTDNYNNQAVQSMKIDPSKRYLYVQMLGGRAFLEHILDEDRSTEKNYNGTLSIHIHFRQQRFQSRPILCACEPDLRDGFLLQLPQHKVSARSDPTSLLSIAEPIHLLLIRNEPNGDKTLLSSTYLEWRKVLSSSHNRWTTAVELNGIGPEAKLSVGLLDLKIELIPRSLEELSKDVVEAQFKLEHNRATEKERLFLVYAKRWWQEYIQIRPVHSKRLVKIFAQDENAVNRFVCSYLKPLRSQRFLDTPRQAARFVSLLAYEEAPIVGGGSRSEVWSNTLAFLCKKKGDCEDHSLLLCSLLVGFGLDAYVCIGTNAKGLFCTWVATIGVDHSVVFWDSLTGQRFNHNPINPDDPPLKKQIKVDHPFKTIGSVFNHKSFYANCQPSDNVDCCYFELNKETKWKAMNEDVIKSNCENILVPSWATAPPLSPSKIDPVIISAELERELQSLITDYRKDLDLSTIWDDNLSYILTSALAAYELERCTGISIGNEEFQHAIRRAVPERHTFKGFPIQFVHRDMRRALASSLKSPVCEEILGCRGDLVRLALRVRIFTYAEDVSAVWIMFAVTYRSVL